MAASNAKLGYGTLLKRGDGATPEVFTNIAEVISITPPTQERPEIEVTHMESPSGFREYIAGLKEPGAASFQVNFLPSDPTQNASAGVIADFTSGVVRNWKIQFPDLSVCSFSAFVKSYVIDQVPVDNRLTMTVNMKLSGSVAWS